MTFILGRVTFIVADWASSLLDRLYVGDQDLPKVIISDRDLKFLGDLQKSLFNKLNISLLYSTAYHLQTNRLYERINQIAEITLRFYVYQLYDISNQLKVLLKLQVLINYTPLLLIGLSAYEVAYRFPLNQVLDLLKLLIKPYQVAVRIQASDAITFSQMNMKFYYDRKHQPLFVRIDNQALLRLYKGYNILVNDKLIRKQAQ